MAPASERTRGRLTSLGGTSLVGVAVVLLLIVSCDSSPSPDPSTIVTASSVRQQRRAYDGAPPVIAHPPLATDCNACHTATGRVVGGMGVAPANPHQSPEMRGRTQNCRQCHLFQRSPELFVAHSFQGWHKSDHQGGRLYPNAPPVIPHGLLMRDSCLSCHDGPAARPEIRCSHPQRTNCRQCHLTHATEGGVMANDEELAAIVVP